MIKEFKNIKDMENTIRTLTASDPQVQTYVSNFSTKFKLLNGLSDDYMNRTDSFDFETWLESDCQSTIFIINPMEHTDLNAPRIAAFFETAIKFWSNYAKRKNRKTTKLYMIIDEFALLSKMDSIAVGLKLLRSSGLSIWVGFQSKADIEDIYGKGGIENIFTNTATKIIFRVSDRNLSEELSALIDKAEIERTEVSETIGSNNDNKHSKNFNSRIIDRNIVSSAEIKALKKHSFYFIQSDHNWVLVDKGGYNHVLNRLESYTEEEVPYENNTKNYFINENNSEDQPVNKELTNEERRVIFGKVS